MRQWHEKPYDFCCIPDSVLDCNPDFEILVETLRDESRLSDEEYEKKVEPVGLAAATKLAEGRCRLAALARESQDTGMSWSEY